MAMVRIQSVIHKMSVKLRESVRSVDNMPWCFLLQIILYFSLCRRTLSNWQSCNVIWEGMSTSCTPIGNSFGKGVCKSCRGRDTNRECSFWWVLYESSCCGRQILNNFWGFSSSPICWSTPTGPRHPPSTLGSMARWRWKTSPSLTVNLVLAKSTVSIYTMAKRPSSSPPAVMLKNSAGWRTLPRLLRYYGLCHNLARGRRIK